MKIVNFNYKDMFKTSSSSGSMRKDKKNRHCFPSPYSPAEMSEKNTAHLQKFWIWRRCH